MPPKKAKQKTSTSSIEGDAANTAPSQAATRQDEQTHTPEQDPTKKTVLGITQAHKQALIDNLQLEITERARKLRAQYALQAQGLRARLEMRVNRIPTALRKRKIQDLLDEYSEKENPQPAPPVPVKDHKEVEVAVKAGSKRQSDQISTLEDDKENSSHDLPNPKKRAKTTATATANTKAARTASRKGAPPTVLSPRSHNSRTLLRSPFKAASPEKPRPTSPAKSQPAAAARGAAGRTASRQQPTKNIMPADEARSSDASNTSSGTTVVTKGTTTAKTKAAAARKFTAAAAKTTATAKKQPAGAKKENVPPAGGRSLRKRA